MNFIGQFNYLSKVYLDKLKNYDQNLFYPSWSDDNWKNVYKLDYIYGLNVESSQIKAFSVYDLSVDGEFAHLLKILTLIQLSLIMILFGWPYGK